MWLCRSLPTKHIPPALDALPNNTWRIDGLPLRKQRLGTEGGFFLLAEKGVMMIFS